MTRYVSLFERNQVPAWVPPLNVSVLVWCVSMCKLAYVRVTNFLVIEKDFKVYYSANEVTYCVHRELQDSTQHVHGMESYSCYKCNVIIFFSLGRFEICAS